MTLAPTLAPVHLTRPPGRVDVRTVLVLGASSAIGRWTADALARRGYALVLAGRSIEDVSRVASDLAIRHRTEVSALHFEACDVASHEALFAEAVDRAGGVIEGVVVAVGDMGDHQRATAEPLHAAEVIAVNLTGPVSVLTVAARYFEGRGRGFLAAVGSVSGDRGRQSNYVYGCAKGGLEIYLQGLRHRLARRGVSVVTIKPGFVDTPMTFGKGGVFLAASPRAVGERIVRAVEHGERVVYTPFFWRFIMLVIRWMPERLFLRTRL